MKYFKYILLGIIIWFVYTSNVYALDETDTIYKCGDLNANFNYQRVNDTGETFTRTTMYKNNEYVFKAEKSGNNIKYSILINNNIAHTKTCITPKVMYIINEMDSDNNKIQIKIDCNVCYKVNDNYEIYGQNTNLYKNTLYNYNIIDNNYINTQISYYNRGGDSLTNSTDGYYNLSTNSFTISSDLVKGTIIDTNINIKAYDELNGNYKIYDYYKIYTPEPVVPIDLGIITNYQSDFFDLLGDFINFVIESPILLFPIVLLLLFIVVMIFKKMIFR